MALKKFIWLFSLYRLSLHLMKILPLKQKRLEVTIHAISWLLVFLFPILLMEWGSRMDWAQYLRHSIVPLCCFLMFYANYLYLVPRYLFRNEVGWFLLFNVVFVVGLAWILQFGHRAPFEPPRPDFVAEGFPGPPPPREWFAWGRHLVMLAFVAGLSTAIRVSLRWRHTEERLVQAEREKADAELVHRPEEQDKGDRPWSHCLPEGLHPGVR